MLLRWVGHVAHERTMGGSAFWLVGLEGEDHLEGLGIQGGTLLKWILLNAV